MGDARLQQGYCHNVGGPNSLHWPRVRPPDRELAASCVGDNKFWDLAPAQVAPASALEQQQLLGVESPGHQDPSYLVWLGAPWCRRQRRGAAWPRTSCFGPPQKLRPRRIWLWKQTLRPGPPRLPVPCVSCSCLPCCSSGKGSLRPRPGTTTAQPPNALYIPRVPRRQPASSIRASPAWAAAALQLVQLTTVPPPPRPLSVCGVPGPLSTFSQGAGCPVVVGKEKSEEKKSRKNSGDWGCMTRLLLSPRGDSWSFPWRSCRCARRASWVVGSLGLPAPEDGGRFRRWTVQRVRGRLDHGARN